MYSYMARKSTYFRPVPSIRLYGLTGVQRVIHRHLRYVNLLCMRKLYLGTTLKQYTKADKVLELPDKAKVQHELMFVLLQQVCTLNVP